jgi:hypothetical protein
VADRHSSRGSRLVTECPHQPFLWRMAWPHVCFSRQECNGAKVQKDTSIPMHGRISFPLPNGFELLITSGQWSPEKQMSSFLGLHEFLRFSLFQVEF